MLSATNTERRLKTSPRTSAAEERLLIEAAQRDPRRFGELYEQNFERVYGFVVGRVRERSEAEDITAEVFHQALANLPRFDWRGVPFAAWLLRIAANAIADRWQRAAREQANRAPEPSVPPNDGEIEEAEQRAALFGLVNTLPEDQRKVIEKRFVEERSIRDIAQMLGRSEGAVKQLQFRALQTLRARLEGSHG